MQLPRKMSAQNVMASISRTLGTRHDSKSSAPNEVRFAGEESKDKLYEPKHKQKLVRVLTVVAYVISVSLAAIILSLYYMFIWDPKDRSHYTIRQTKGNITAKVECVNLSLPVPIHEPPEMNETHIQRTATKSTRTYIEFPGESLRSDLPLQTELLNNFSDTTENLSTSSTTSTTSPMLTTPQEMMEIYEEDRHEKDDKDIFKDHEK